LHAKALGGPPKIALGLAPLRTAIPSTGKKSGEIGHPNQKSGAHDSTETGRAQRPERSGETQPLNLSFPSPRSARERHFAVTVHLFPDDRLPRPPLKKSRVLN
jgi:hypothetical protein